MKKLTDLRADLLASPLGVTPNRLLTAAESGSVRADRGTRNAHLELTYRAAVIVTDWSGDPRTLLWWVTDWMHRTSPAAAADAVSFHADIIDHDRADVEIRLDLTETVRATATDAGVQLDREPDPDAQALDMAALFPVMR
ncbi:phage tail protein [Rhodospira trueperi]|uniref:P2 phage tail completion protein R (GpR) n=1 Tax=Rhodospira trueperi TaxID=69960 RepID=A0A1G7HWZ0_9PROT|nr:phage tail protein [Rhodospira trueperi]SDF04863.1 P2 phage tail completion protein R (GpR) [Rhodospira trueperi]